MRRVRILFLFCLILILTSAAWASDKAKEKRWADQIVDFVMVGEAVWLDTGRDKFLGLYTEAADQAKGAAIVMHGVGVHPDWPDVVQPLRSRLPENGWSTLSIQMPILPNEAKFVDYEPLFDEVPARIDAAVKYLKGKGHHHLVLVGHSLGNDMAAYYLVNGKSESKDIKAFVAVSMTSPREQRLPPSKEMIKLLEKVSIPMLDLYGMDDKEAVAGAAARKTAGGKIGRYDQKNVAGTDHFFRDKNDILIKTVASWITPFGKTASK